MDVSRLLARFYRWLGTLSGAGLALGLLFFAFSLTPSLIPRTPATQGMIAGICFAAGYAIGASGRFIWRFLDLPQARGNARRVPNAVILGLCLCLVIYCLWMTNDWQNSIRAVMDQPPVASASPMTICAIALAIYLVLLGIARAAGFAFRFLSSRSKFVLPPRAALLAGIVMTAAVFWSIGSNVLVRTAFAVMDNSLKNLDALVEPEQARPSEPNKTGSDVSLVRWDDLGRMGRRYIAGAPTAQQISAVTGRPAKDPLRVYVGLNGGETADDRAKLALAELIRIGGFERKVLVVVTPTGTGWVDAAAMNSVEYLHDGDVSSVAIQYSYLSSPLALLAGPEQHSETSIAMFRAIYAHWTRLPLQSRPKFYLHGLSLGSLNSEHSLNLFEMLSDPIDGALWSGPPFANTVWSLITAGRNPDTPQWLPHFGDNTAFRFMNQNGFTTPPDARWGRLRIVYLQYASDAISFFDYRDLWRRPDWMAEPRGPDVSQELRWFPFVTMIQLALDMMVANKAPLGFGHSYAPDHYLDGWVAVTAQESRPAEDISAIKAHLLEQARQAAGNKDGAYGGRGG